MSCGGCSCETTANRATCPACGQEGESVGHTTLLHQLRTPWQQSLDEGTYYFCASAECDTVYFSTTGRQMGRDAIRQEVGQKSYRPDRMLCYCFDIRYSDLAAAAERCRDYVIDKTRDNRCACVQRNPSGRCCLRDFPREEE